MRRPKRSVDNRTSSPGLDSKKVRGHPFGCPLTFFKRETGIGPATLSLARRCSTAEPLARVAYSCVRLTGTFSNILYAINFVNIFFCVEPTFFCVKPTFLSIVVAIVTSIVVQ